MGQCTISVRNETMEALQGLAVKANESQDEVDVSLSDVIDGVLRVMENMASPEDVLEEILNVAAEN